MIYLCRGCGIDIKIARLVSECSHLDHHPYKFTGVLAYSELLTALQEFKNL